MSLVDYRKKSKTWKYYTLRTFDEFPFLYDLYMKFRLIFKRNIPTIVYSYGKAGVSSLYLSLKHCGLSPVFQSHYLLPDNTRNSNQFPKYYSESLYKNIILKKKNVKILTVVRDPIAQAVSGFFHGFFKDNDPKSCFTTDGLVKSFLEYQKESESYDWFDYEMKKVLGIDVYSAPFSHNEGSIILKNDFAEVLILRLELEDSIKEKKIMEFFDIDKFKWLRLGHAAKNSLYYPIYENFVKTVNLPDWYLDQMLNNKYTKHFYSGNEIEAIKSKWK